MVKFSIGDRVVSVVDRPDGNKRIHIGDTGVVCNINGGRIGVEWDNHVGGHDCTGCCTNGYGWWVDICDVELDGDADNEPFEIDEDEFEKLILGVENGAFQC